MSDNWADIQPSPFPPIEPPFLHLVLRPTSAQDSNAMNQSGHPTVGIDDIAAYIPQLYLPIEELAAERDLNYEKLNKGLGLQAMSVSDVGEDTATLAANAIVDLLRTNDLDPHQIGRIYLGTESALDGAKPTATYALEMLEQHFELEYGPNCFLHCDVLDMTFACIGTVDALQNTLDWVRNGADRIGIVVAADIAEYELGSPGEYTQGAGAIALLVKQAPRLLAFEDTWGVATRAVHDFYKPYRKARKADLIREVLEHAGIDSTTIEHIEESIHAVDQPRGILDCTDVHLSLHKRTPVFDGQYSNECYQGRLFEAYQSYRQRAGTATGEAVIQEWDRLVFHLPYAYQARRMFSELFMEDLKASGQWNEFTLHHELAEPCAGDFPDRDVFYKACSSFLRSITKTTPYKEVVAEKIERGERASSLVGNLYTGSIFLSLMSTLEADLQEGNDLSGASIGFFAYGSGSKSKVFRGVVQPQWRSVTERFRLMARLESRQAIDYSTYEDLHRGVRETSVASMVGAFFLADVHEDRDEREGARMYGYRAQEVNAATE